MALCGAWVYFMAWLSPGDHVVCCLVDSSQVRSYHIKHHKYENIANLLEKQACNPSVNVNI